MALRDIAQALSIPTNHVPHGGPRLSLAIADDVLRTLPWEETVSVLDALVALCRERGNLDSVMARHGRFVTVDRTDGPTPIVVTEEPEAGQISMAHGLAYRWEEQPYTRATLVIEATRFGPIPTRHKPYLIACVRRPDVIHVLRIVMATGRPVLYFRDRRLSEYRNTEDADAAFSYLRDVGSEVRNYVIRQRTRDAFRQPPSAVPEQMQPGADRNDNGPSTNHELMEGNWTERLHRMPIDPDLRQVLLEMANDLHTLAYYEGGTAPIQRTPDPDTVPSRQRRRAIRLDED